MPSKNWALFWGLGFVLGAAALAVSMVVWNPFTWSILPGGEEEVEPVEEVVVEEPLVKQKTIGQSVEGRAIDVYSYGTGDKHLLFIGGVHGGYEWNSSLLAYMMMDYLEANINLIPTGVKVSIIPVANPDGLFKVVGTGGRFTVSDVPGPDDGTGRGRFNANSVDLNRNFDCKWQPESSWRSKVVSAGTAPFSEPESAALRDFILANNLTAVVSWHSQSNAVYAAECGEGISPATMTLMNTYSQASGYPAMTSFDHYEITGDMEGWLATIRVPAVTVELTTHETVEWAKNLAGVKAILELYK
ncbi:MAG: M14 family metallopeptidase [Candidatus Paceibacterota bacterium]